MTVIAIAIITQSRRRIVAQGGRTAARIAASAGLTWRMVLIAVVVLIAWLLVVALLVRLNVQFGVEQPPPDAALRRPDAPVRDGAAEQPEQPEPPSGVFSLSPGRRSC